MSKLLLLSRCFTKVAKSSSSLLIRRTVVPAITVNVATPVRYFSTQEKETPTPGVGKWKTSTGLTGLKVEPDWYNILLARCQALLDRMEESDMPETAQFRIDVTKWCNYIIKTVKANPDDPEAVEDAVNMGQVEELIEMAEDEMIAVDTYLSVRMWELVEDLPPTEINYEGEDPMKDPMGEDEDEDMKEAIRQGVEKMKTEAKK